MEQSELTIIIDQVKHDLEKMEQYNKSAHKDIYERLGKLENQAPVTEMQFKQIMDALQDMKADLKTFKAEIKVEIDAIKSAPGKRWESLTATIIACITTGIAAFILSKIF